MEADDKAILELLRSIPDPEIPTINIVELGVVRGVARSGASIVVTMTPTYSGCPALQVMKDDIISLLTAHGFKDVQIQTSYSPAWSTDWLSAETKEKLRASGIAPPESSDTLIQIGPTKGVSCPRCRSTATSELSSFGPTACKALYRCNSCREPFEYFKPL